MTGTAHARRVLALWTIAALLVVACESRSAQKKPAAKKVEAAPKVAMPDSPVKGPATAPVTIVEVSDFQ